MLTYGASLGVTLLATLLTWWILPLRQHLPLALFYGAVFVSTFVGGLKPGLLAILLSLGAANTLLAGNLPPAGGLDHSILMITFTCVTGIICYLTHSRQRTQQIEKALYQSELALRLSQERLQVILDSVPCLISYVDTEQRYQFVNAAYETWFNLTRQQIVGRTVCESMGEKNYQQAAPYLAAALQGRRQRYEIVAATRDSVAHNLLVEYVPHMGPQGVAGVYVVIVDITDRIRAEEQVRASEAHLRALIEHAGEAIFIATDDRVYVDVNAAACELSGYSRDELIGMSINQLTPATLQGRLDEERPLLLQGEKRIAEWQLVRKDGQLIPVEASIKQLPNGQWQAFVRDITARKQAEQERRQLNQELERRVAERTAQLAASNQELERSNQALEQFTYVASHDLRAPLRAVHHLAEWISEDAAALLPPASQEHLVKLRGRVRRMEKLIEDLLAFSRAGRYRYALEQVNTRVLVEDMLRLLNPPQTFTITIAEVMPVLVTPRVPLEIVLRNLIGNAIKHHHQPHLGHVQVWAEPYTQGFTFFVQDDGPGIAPEFHQRIFDLFQTLQPRDQVEGSGMGLTLVKKLVESYGGAIAVTSAAGAGATFHFTWPALTDEKSTYALAATT